MALIYDMYLWGLNYLDPLEIINYYQLVRVSRPSPS